MAKKFTKEELKEKAQEYFKSYPSVDLFYVTEDGMFFTQNDRDYAYDHNTKVVKGKVHSITRVVEKAEVEASDEEMEALKARYEELFEKAAPSNIKKETLQKKIEEAESQTK